MRSGSALLHARKLLLHISRKSTYNVNNLVFNVWLSSQPRERQEERKRDRRDKLYIHRWA